MTGTRVTPTHPDPRIYLRNVGRDLKGGSRPQKAGHRIGAAIDAVVSWVAGKTGLSKARQGDALRGAEAGATPRRSILLPGPDPLSAPGAGKQGVPALNRETTHRVAELFRLGKHNLNVPEGHERLRPLIEAIAQGHTVRQNTEHLPAAVDALIETGLLSLTDYRLALTLLHLAGEIPARDRLKTKATELYQSDLSPAHYSMAASFYDTDAAFHIDGDVMLSVLKDRDA